MPFHGSRYDRAAAAVGGGWSSGLFGSGGEAWGVFGLGSHPLLKGRALQAQGRALKAQLVLRVCILLVGGVGGDDYNPLPPRATRRAPLPL